MATVTPERPALSLVGGSGEPREREAPSLRGLYGRAATALDELAAAMDPTDVLKQPCGTLALCLAGRRLSRR